MESGPPSTPPTSDTDHESDSAGSSPRRIGALLAAADIAGFRATETGVITDVNDAFASLTGYGRSELEGASITDLVTDDDDILEGLVATDAESESEAETDAAALLESGAEPVSIPVSLRTKGESYISCDLHLEVFPGPDDEREFGGIVDRRPSATATVSEPDLTYGKTFQALAEALPDGIIVLDTNSDIQYANPAIERILGYTPDELVGSSKVNIIPPRLRQTHLDALQRYLETGERHLNWTYVELPGQHKAGHEVPLAVSLNDFTYDGDRYFVGLFRDISPRKAAEQALTEKVVQLESVNYLGRYALENPDVDDLLDKATRLIETALDVECCLVLETDPSPGDAPGLAVRASVGCSDALLENETTPALSSSEPALLAERTLADGEPIVVESFAADDRVERSSVLADTGIQSGMGVTIGPADDPWGVLAVYDDQEREFADHDVDFLESTATLLATGIERQQYERRLNETVADLEESNERLEQFAYAASHDLQEPLRMVSSYLQLVEDRYVDELDEDAEEFIEFAVDGAERMREMIDGLLAYSRIDSQGDPFEPVDLDDVLEDVLTDLQVKIEDTDAEITTESLPTVEGDDSQLRQLFQNLLSNALEYSGDEPPRVHVAVERNRRTWEISVEDEGIGIDPDETDRVFRVFQRLHSRDEYPGTGIGLALCRRIVERHGGRIWVDSEPGEGSTFAFTIPVDGPQNQA
ncbi:PAS domain-containing sensor histidine kinase [Halopiger xanaduensis]|uniref:histidine kinase n=1 Tax=Halopiger xanaduensis (strain DSM 18323 / JCM 14033 / SH-6) TaxID=797210 RepID=F8D9Q6_HALXS|nr:PAS domain S-box protein [Halopiger xanaduensis]AEH37591.1 multi-sensor signal transduction histidine kinase [Halopiger xanaduensis SH-6]